MLLFCSIGCIDEIVAIHAFLSSHANMIRKTKIVKSKKHLEYLARNYPCLKCRTTYGIQACHRIGSAVSVMIMRKASII